MVLFLNFMYKLTILKIVYKFSEMFSVTVFFPYFSHQQHCITFVASLTWIKKFLRHVENITACLLSDNRSIYAYQSY